jgi:hypothetical protein
VVVTSVLSFNLLIIRLTVEILIEKDEGLPILFPEMEFASHAELIGTLWAHYKG